MSYTVLARKYRPQKFSDVIGQDHVTKTLQNALEQQRIAHGYIFSGHRGIGKTTIARILAMALNCQSSDRPVGEPCGVCDSCREIRDGSVGAMDVIEIDAATNRGIEDVRGLIATATAEPARDRYRIFILDEAHQVTEAAFNALLKTLEEPPEWVVFMMATTQPEDIPQTIRSRCQHFSFHAVAFEEIVGQLRMISTAEGITVDDDALAVVAEAGDGSMRDALSIMDQAIACCGTTLTAEGVRGLIGSVSSEILEETMTAVHENSAEKVLRIADKLLTHGHSAAYFTRQFTRFLRNTIVCKVAGNESQLLQVSTDEKARVARIAEFFTEEELTRFMQIMLRTHSEVSFKQEQRFHLELGLLKLVHAQRLLPLEQLLSAAQTVEAKVAQPAAAHSASPGMTRNAQASPPPSMRTPPPSMSQRRPGYTPVGGASPFGSAPRTASPLERDNSRKNTPEQSAATPAVRAVAAPIPIRPSRVEAPQPAAQMVGNGTPLPVAAPAAPPETAEAETVSVDAIREAILAKLESDGQKMLASTLEEGEWRLQGRNLTLSLTDSEVVLNVTFGAEQRKLVAKTATQFAGHPVKLTVVGGAAVAKAAKPARQRPAGSSEARAAEEPLVKRMTQRFGAEIRSVIDYTE
jgi:DNA polymerase-3 subunit gamma/tau